MYPTSFPGLGHGRRAVSGAGSVTAADVGLILDCAFTGALTFAAAATLGNQFQVAFYVSSGTVTLTGNGAETIQSPAGSANTFVLTAGQGAYVSCDGTGLKVILSVGLAPAPATTITTTTIQAATSAGIEINNSSGTQVMLIGPGPGTGVSFAGGVNVTGGTLTVTTADINGGTLDGVTIGGASAASATVTTLNVSGVATLSGNQIISGSAAPSILKNLTSTSYVSQRFYNDQDNGARSLEQGYSGSAYASSILTGAPTGEAGYLTTTGNYPLLLGQNNTSRIEITSSDVTIKPAVTCSSTLTTADTNLGRTTAGYTNGAAASVGTLTNAPAAGNPTKWIPINDNGTTRYIPAW